MSSKEVVYYTSDYYHAEKRFFTKNEILEAKNSCSYHLVVIRVLGYKKNISPKRVFSNFFFSINVFFRLLIRVKKSDTIIIPSRPVELIYFISIIKKIKGIKIFLDIQDIWPDALKINNRLKNRLFTHYCNLFLYPSLKHYTNSFHVAPSFTQWLRRYAPGAPSIFVPLGWENKRWITTNFIKSHTNNKSILKIVCVAQLQHQIDIMPVLELLKSNESVFFTVIGEDGTGERYGEVIEYIKSNHLTNVKILGKTDRGKVQELLKDQDIGILPMITSSIPNKVFDYIASFLPIIVLGENDSSRFVKDNNIGWSCNYTSKDLSNLINKINRSEINVKKDNLLKIRNSFSRDELHKEIYKVLNQYATTHTKTLQR
jgi:hypothetical protein